MTTFTRLMTSLCLLLKADTETRTLNRLITNQLRHHCAISASIYLFSIQIHSQYKKSHVSLHDSFQNYLLNFADENLNSSTNRIEEKSLTTITVTRLFPNETVLSYKFFTAYFWVDNRGLD